MPRLFFIFFAACLFVATPLLADWKQFRGPTGQGHVEGPLPVTWSDEENVVWKTEIPGEGWSSPVVHQGQIYLTAAIPQGDEEPYDYSLQLLRLRASDGKVLSSSEIFRQTGADAPRIHRKNSHASPTPLIEGKQLFVHFGHQGTACLDLAGNVIWTKKLNYRPVHGNGGTPILVDGALVFSCDGAQEPFVVALDRNRGTQLWKTPRATEVKKKFSFSTPLMITVAGQRQIISPGSNAVCAYDPATGAEIWRVGYDGYSVIPRPVYGHGLVFVCTGYDSPSLLAIRPDGQGDVTETHVAWTLKKSVPHTPSLILVGPSLFMVSDRGVASCVAAKTGELHWRERIGGNFSSSPILANGLIYLQDETGTTTVIEAAKQFQVRATNKVNQRTLASFAADEATIYLRSDSHLFAIKEQP